MRRTEALQGVRVAMFLNVRSRWESAELNEDEAAELLGVSTRTFRRWRNRCDEQGELRAFIGSSEFSHREGQGSALEAHISWAFR